MPDKQTIALPFTEHFFEVTPLYYRHVELHDAQQEDPLIENY